MKTQLSHLKQLFIYCIRRTLLHVGNDILWDLSEKGPTHLSSPIEVHMNVVNWLACQKWNRNPIYYRKITHEPITQMEDDLSKFKCWHGEEHLHPFGPSLITILKPSSSPSCFATSLAVYRRRPRISKCLSSACRTINNNISTSTIDTEISVTQFNLAKRKK